MISALSFFVIMLGLAALPSASVALVVTRAATHGAKDGVAVASGIVAGDLIFVGLVLVGMSVLAESMGAFFAVLKYCGGAYLIWLGYSLLRSKATFTPLELGSENSSLIASFVAGLLLTLGDLKAILFYASLFPSLVDLAALSAIDIALIVMITVITVGGVKTMYALAARNLFDRFFSSSPTQHAGTVAGGLLMGTGTYIIVKS